MDELITLVSGSEMALPLLVAGNVLLLSVAAYVMFGRTTAGDRQRDKQLSQMQMRWSTVGGAQGVSLLRAKESEVPGLDQILKRWLPRREALHLRLERTGRQISIGYYVVSCVVVGIVTAVAVLVFSPLPAVLSATIGIAVGLMVPHVVVGIMAAGRRKAFLGNFPEAIDLIVRGVRSGLPVSESLGVVGKELPDPVGEEFRRIEQAMRLGRTMDQAMWDAARRIDVTEFNFFVISLSVQRETGGNLAETLENLGDILRRRRQMRLKVKALSSEAKASAYLLGSLPFVMFVMMMLVNSDYATTLIVDSRGHLMMAGGMLSLSVGAAVMAKMCRFEI